MTKQRGGTTAEAKDKESTLMKRKKDSGIQRHRIWTRERRKNTEVNKDREKLLKKQRRKQRIPKTERIDETTRRNDSGSQRQRE